MTPADTFSLGFGNNAQRQFVSPPELSGLENQIPSLDLAATQRYHTANFAAGPPAPDSAAGYAATWSGTAGWIGHNGFTYRSCPRCCPTNP